MFFRRDHRSLGGHPTRDAEQSSKEGIVVRAGGERKGSTSYPIVGERGLQS